MAEPAGQAVGLPGPAALVASQPSRSTAEPNAVNLTARQDASKAKPKPSAGTASGATHKQQKDGAPRPVFKMKRTGNGTLPQAPSRSDRSASHSSTASPPAVAVQQPPVSQLGPLPSGWKEMGLTNTAPVYFVDHNTKTTTWDDSRLRSSLDQNVPHIFQGPNVDCEPEPAQVASDTLSPAPPQPLSNPSWDASSGHPKVSSASDGTRKTKYATDEERRRTTSMALKERWASGAMDNAHKKRMETMRRKREAKNLLGMQRRTKPPGPGCFAGTPKHQAGNVSLISEKVAPIFDDKPASNGLASEYQHGAIRPSSAAPEKPGIKPPPARPFINHLWSPPSVASQNGDDGHDHKDWEGDSSLTSVSGFGEPTQALNREEEGEIGVEGSPPALLLSASGRPYGKWKINGVLASTFGALIPDGYELSTTTPHHPWICPVRSCRKVFTRLSQLGVHFSRIHRGVLLHDNQDGTFAECGKYAPLRGGPHQVSKPEQPAIVVSRGPAGPSDPPPLAPSNLRSSVGGDQTLDARDPETTEADGGANSIVAETLGAQQADQMTLPNGEVETLWNYLQPYLIKHKGPTIPDRGWVQELLPLPKVRDLDWNIPWLETHPFNDTKSRDISALILQVTGDPAPKPCKRCSEGKGLFRSCIMISTRAPAPPLLSIFGCANCFYHCGQTNCTNKQWGAQRAQRILAAREILSGNRKGESPKSDIPADSLDESRVGEAVEDRSEEEEETVSPVGQKMENASPLPTDGVPTAIEEAEPGRPYSMWPDENGQLSPLFGSLLPSGYQFDTTIDGRPWICPIRTCRKTFSKKSDLGFHFERLHFAALLNDNGDGTFTVKGVYRSKQKGIRGTKIILKAPPIVVSKETLDDSIAGPLPEAQLPTYLAPRASLIGLPQKQEPKFDQVKSKSPETNDPADLWAYIKPHLAMTKTVPSNAAVRHLLTLPRRRDLEFNPRGHGFREFSAQDIAALLVQLTGDEAQESCRRCRKGKGPFQGCVLMPESARFEAKRRYPCCGNCLYQGQKLHCSLMKWVEQRDSSGNLASRGDEMDIDDVEPVAATTAPSRSLRETRRQNLSTHPSFSSASSSCRPPLAPSTSALISQGTFHGPEGLLEMEDWELAPGRIKESSNAGNHESKLTPTLPPSPPPMTDRTAKTAIAFSKPYLSTSQAIPVSDDVAFRVDTISAGNTLTLEADANQIRLCSVAAGKVSVTIGGEEGFSVGPHGMFKVKPGVACTVKNGLYLEAVVHIVVLTGYS
ncbi:hypothetical protein VTI74DRAFT_11099 [Chaetomium olivicolor]